MWIARRDIGAVVENALMGICCVTKSGTVVMDPMNLDAASRVLIAFRNNVNSTEVKSLQNLVSIFLH